MIVDKVRDQKSKSRNVYPCYNNRASEIGHECLRYLVLNRTKWNEKTLPSTDLMFIFDEGNLHEGSVIRALEDSGIEVFEQQNNFLMEDCQISGHIDAKVRIDGEVIPIEIKSASPFMYESFDSINDLLNCKYQYARKYVAQFQIYLHMCKASYGYFIFKNKVNGQLKEIRLDKDDSVVAGLIKKAKEVNKHVEEKTLPPCTLDYDLCEQCSFKHICGVKHQSETKEIEIKDNHQIEADMSKMFELKDSHKEYEKLNKKLKSLFKGIEKQIIGSVLVTGEEVARKGFTVAASKYWKTKYQILEK